MTNWSRTIYFGTDIFPFRTFVPISRPINEEIRYGPNAETKNAEYKNVEIIKAKIVNAKNNNVKNINAENMRR